MSVNKYAQILGNTMSKSAVQALVEEFKNEPDGYQILMHFTLGKEQGQAFRASWVLEHLILSDEHWLKPNVMDFLIRFKWQRNDSSLRHFYKILAWLTAKKQYKVYEFEQLAVEWDQLIDLAFQDILDEDIKVAVKSQAMSFLANLNPVYPWIREQLLEIIELLEERESVAFFAKAKMIRKQLK